MIFNKNPIYNLYELDDSWCQWFSTWVTLENFYVAGTIRRQVKPIHKNWNICDLCEYQDHTSLSPRIIFEIFLLFMNVFDVYSQMMKIRKWLSTRFTFLIFLIIFVIQNIRAQSLPNHKHFEVYYSYKKACRVSIWRPIYRYIVDIL